MAWPREQTLLMHELRATGLSHREIAKRLGCSFRAVQSKLERDTKKAPTVASTHRQVGALVIKIPKWIPQDLWDEFVDFTMLYGELAAACYCRRLKREASAP